MAGPCALFVVFLTFTVELTISSPYCRVISYPNRTLLECERVEELRKCLAKPIINITGVDLVTDDDGMTGGYDFSNFSGLNYLGLRINNLSEVLPEIYGVNKVQFLNISSNNLETTTNITQFYELQDLDLSNNTLHEVDFYMIPQSIKTLKLQHNRIVMESNVTLPKSLTHLDLSYNQMTSVKPILSETLKYLNLTGNNLTELDFVPSLISVEILDLSLNNITDLEDDLFSTLGSLIRLDLSRNMIRFLRERSFSGLQRLQIIDLSNNYLQSIAPGTFQYLNNLIWLNLGSNPDMGNVENFQDTSLLLGTGQRLQTVDVSRTNLTKVPNTLTRSVRNLYLSCNRISNIQCGDLDSFLLLQILDLSSNSISVIEDDALGRLELLYYLLLSENLLKLIPHSLPDNLLVLDLDHNLIQNLSASDFFGLSKLRTLRLAWNQVSVINDQAFGQLSSLQNLDLSGNPVKMLSSSTFIGPRELINLGLSSLTSIVPTKTVLAFPVPESDHLQVLNLENSPVLVSQLMEDVAALSMFRHIKVLNLARSNLSSLRSDLVNFFPRLQVLDLRGIKFNCTDVFWLSAWLRRLREDLSDEQRLQNLDSMESQGYDFDLAQDVLYYKMVMRTSKDPVCYAPRDLRGISLIDLDPPATTTTQRTTMSTVRYDRHNLTYDHEFYQNDFPAFEADDKKQYKRNNVSKIVPKDELKTLFSSLEPVPTVKPKNLTKTLNDSEKVSNKVEEFIFSPLDITVHESESKESESVSSPQRISSEDLEVSKNQADDDGQRYTHHPGLVVFIIVAVALGIAAVAMRATQRRQSRHGYAQQQDIEVRSLDLSGQELW